MIIKVCGNKEKSNVIDVANLKPDMMGFIFYDKSPRFVDLENISEVLRNIKGIKKVGVFVNASEEYIKTVVEKLKLDLIQLHGDETVEFCKEVNTIAPIIKVLDGNAKNLGEQVQVFSAVVSYFLIDNKARPDGSVGRGTEFGGTGKKFNHENLIGINFLRPFLIAGGIGSNDVELVNQLSKIPDFYGIDLNSKFEIEPGIKNIEMLRDFMSKI